MHQKRSHLEGADSGQTSSETYFLNIWPEWASGLYARIGLNLTVSTWTYSRHTGLVIFAQRQEDEMGVLRPSGRKVVESRFYMFARMDPSIFRFNI